MKRKKIYKHVTLEKLKEVITQQLDKLISSQQWILGYGREGPIGTTGFKGIPLETGPFEEDMASFAIWFALHQGEILKIRRTWSVKTAVMGKQLIEGYRNGMLLEKLIEPIVEQLERHVIATPGMDEFMKNGHLPGVTKIRIQRRWSVLRYTTEHKMGKQGGRNFHLTGEFKLKK